MEKEMHTYIKDYFKKAKKGILSRMILYYTYAELGLIGAGISVGQLVYELQQNPATDPTAFLVATTMGAIVTAGGIIAGTQEARDMKKINNKIKTIDAEKCNNTIN